MPKELTPHFSRKVLLISFIFLLANLGIYGLRYMVGQPDLLRSVAPKLVSEKISEVEIKSAYDEAYVAAQPDQEVFSGSFVKTEEGEFVELVLGENSIKLDENTEVQLLRNTFQGGVRYMPDMPRLILKLHSGNIWVDAFDLLEIETQRSRVRLNHGIAIMTYSAPINRLMVVTGAADLKLLTEEGEVLSEFVVPLHNQVTFVDTQLTETYAALKPSKLRKELKMTPISEAVLEGEWVAQNAYDFQEDQATFSSGLIMSSLSYRLRSAYQSVVSALTFIPEARRNLPDTSAWTRSSSPP
jgi:hypothetical protein